MKPTADWSAVARRATALMPAGPEVSPTYAAATVARLRAGARWSEGHLGELSGMPAEARAVAATPVRVVDRRGYAVLLAELIDGEMPSAPARPTWFGARESLSMVKSLRRSSREALGFFLPTAPGPARILVAPNVLERAVDAQLDQGDYSRWVAVRCGLWGVIHTKAPWLVDMVRALMEDFLHEPEDLVRLVCLMDASVSTCLATITPRQIPSVEWIRRRGPLPSGASTLAGLPLGPSAPDASSVYAEALAFCGAASRDNPEWLSRMLSSPDALPTFDEMARPDAWRRRVGA